MTITSHRYYLHLLKYGYLYLPLLVIVLVSSIYAFGYSHGQPLIIGPESYYHLTAFHERSWSEYFPLGMAVSFIPQKMLIIFPLLLMASSVLFLFVLASRLKLDPELRFLFILFLVLTPAFLFSASTISTSMLTFFLILAGFVLLTHNNNNNNNNKSKYLALIPFALVSFIDLFGALIVLLLLMIYRSTQKRDKKGIVKIMILIMGFVVLNGLFLNESFIPGPFHLQKITADLVSDLGGMSGIGFTILLLSIIGILTAWRRKEYRWMYILLPILILVYMYSTQMIVYLSIVLAFFAAIGYKGIFIKKWDQPTLKMFTILLILLSICFSSASYIQRTSAIGPIADNVAALTWIKNNIPSEKVIVTSLEQGYYVRYFAQHEPFYEPHQQEKTALEKTLLNSTYIGTTFPILEQYNVGAVYVTPKWKEQYPADQGGLLFLLKNERFKLAYSYEGHEVWVFE